MPRKKRLHHLTPAEFRALIEYTAEAEILSLTGVSWHTLYRWKLGRSKVPHAVVHLLRWHISGQVPDGHEWAGWVLGNDGQLYPPSWGEGFTRDDVINLFWWRKEAFRARGLERRVLELEKQVKFYRDPAHQAAKLGFMHGLVEVLHEGN